MLVLLVTVTSTRNHLLLFQGAMNRARILLGIAYLPPTIPSSRNNLFLVYSVKIILVIGGCPPNIPFIIIDLFLLPHIYNRAMILLGVADLPLTIPSTRNLLFLLHGVFNKVRMILG